MNTSIEHTGAIIKKLREENGESQEELAEAVNAANRETIARWESGARDIKREHIIALAKHYGVSTDYLLGLSEIQTDNEKVQNACEVTGLSEEAIRQFENMKSDDIFSETFIDSLSEMLSSKFIFQLTEEFCTVNCMSLYKFYFEKALDFLTQAVNNCDFSEETREAFKKNLFYSFAIPYDESKSNPISKISEANSLAVKTARYTASEELSNWLDWFIDKSIPSYAQGIERLNKELSNEQVFSTGEAAAFSKYISNGLEQVFENCTHTPTTPQDK